MDDSQFIHELNKALYFYYNKSSLLLRSRAYTLASNIRIAVREPQIFAKKVVRLILRNPHKLMQILLGQRTIQNTSEDSERLDREYLQWITKIESTQFNVEKQKRKAQKFNKQPLISLITPVFDPPVEVHDKLIESVMAQTYSNFELLLFNFGKDRGVRQLLDTWAAKDARIIVKHDLPNGGISKNSNLCLEYVAGEYVGLLDHDDALTTNALYECVKAINKHNAEFIYSDKDKISEDDKRHNPLFKPDWSPEMALGGNYLTHFNLMRTQIVRDLGGWDPETDGAQDWDLFLRILDTTNKIVHIPRILYHWRTIEGSTATNISVKPYALAAQRLAVNKHLDRKGLKAKAMQDGAGQTFIEWPLQKKPRSYVIHLLYGDVDQTLSLIDMLIAAPDFHHASQIFLCTGKGLLDDKQRAKLKDGSTRAEYIEYRSGTFARAVTDCLRTAGHQEAVYITDSNKKISNLLNGTAWISQLCGWLGIEGVNMAGAASYAEDGKVVDIGSFFDTESQTFEKYYFSTGFRSGYNGYIQWIRNFILVSERLYALNTSLLSSAGWETLADGIRDDEFCQGLALVSQAANGRGVYDPSVNTIDSAPFYYVFPPSTSTGNYIIKKCPGLLKADPYYNPNLDESYQDPKPRSLVAGSTPANRKFRVRTTDLG